MLAPPCVLPQRTAAYGGYGACGTLPEAVWQRLRGLQGQLSRAQRRALDAEAALRLETEGRLRAEAALQAERRRRAELQRVVAAAADARCVSQDALVERTAPRPQCATATRGTPDSQRCTALALPDCPRERTPPFLSPRTRGAALVLPESPCSQVHALPPGSPRTRAAGHPLVSPRSRGATLELPKTPPAQQAVALGSELKAALRSERTRARAAVQRARARARRAETQLRDATRAHGQQLVRLHEKCKRLADEGRSARRDARRASADRRMLLRLCGKLRRGLAAQRGAGAGSPRPRRCSGASWRTPPRSADRSEVEVTPAPRSPDGECDDGEEGTRGSLFAAVGARQQDVIAQGDDRSQLSEEETAVNEQVADFAEPAAVPPDAMGEGADVKFVLFMPVHEALMVDAVCHCVSMFAPRKWAPVCSTTARSVMGGQIAFHAAWRVLQKTFHPFLTLGASCEDHNRRWGPEYGLFWAAHKEVRSLRRKVLESARLTPPPGDTMLWVNRWMLYLEGLTHVYDQVRLRYSELWEWTVLCRCNHAAVRDTLEEVLEQRSRRLEGADSA
eukprot:TRINITY_DN8385_c1_g1_i2.p1 TRINITY_DN8385_c1_g1~~TRINITY_DN8385_c1_g1_i2.p1  ORF type:complete len:588 (+),score=51.00 TRINITY_DN8385_c1_g1_i2:76-1764(+)